VFLELLPHRRHLGIAERVVLQVGEAPVGFPDAGIHDECRLIGGLALRAPAERLMDVAHDHRQPHFIRLELRRPFVGLERLFVAHEARRHRAQGQPSIGVFRLDRHQTAGGSIRLLEAPELHQGLSDFSPDQRMVCGLLQGVVEQPLGIPRFVSRDR
jgi:hypothetical protein